LLLALAMADPLEWPFGALIIAFLVKREVAERTIKRLKEGWVGSESNPESKIVSSA
jgi:hypothetical protein